MSIENLKILQISKIVQPKFLNTLNRIFKIKKKDFKNIMLLFEI